MPRSICTLLTLALWHSLYLPPLWAASVTKKFHQPFVAPWDETTTKAYACPTIAGVSGAMRSGRASWRSSLLPKSKIRGVKITAEGPAGSGYGATLENHSQPRLAVQLVIHLTCDYHTAVRTHRAVEDYDVIDALLDAAMAEETN